MEREDGRSPLQLRPLAVEFGILSGATGSARFSFGGRSAVVVAVYGPVDPPTQRKSFADRACVEVNVRATCGPLGEAERRLETELRGALQRIVLLEELPRTLISIFVQPIAEEGCFLACCLNGAMCALLDAGIPVKDTCFSVAIAAVWPGLVATYAKAQADTAEVLLVDPLDQEVEASSATACFAFGVHSSAIYLAAPVSGAGFASEATGGAKSQWSAAMELGLRSCAIVGSFVREQFEEARLRPIRNMVHTNNFRAAKTANTTET